jgi:hypothetical protein
MARHFKQSTQRIFTRAAEEHGHFKMISEFRAKSTTQLSCRKIREIYPIFQHEIQCADLFFLKSKKEGGKFLRVENGKQKKFRAFPA